MFKYLKIVSKALFPLICKLPKIRKYAKKKEKYPLIERYDFVSSFLNYFVSKKLKVVFYVNGLENLPKDSTFLGISNHQSNMDPLCYLSLLNKGVYNYPLTFLSKKEVLKFPVVNEVLTSIDGVFMDRQNFRSEIRAISQITNILKSNKQSVIIFSEGTRARDIKHEVAEFKSGSLKPAFNSNKLIVPFAIYGGFRVLDKKCDLKAFPVQISILKPVKTSDFANTQEASKYLHNIISNEVDVLRKNDEELVKNYLPKNSKVEVDISGL